MKLKIGAKLGLGFAAVLATMTVAAGVTFHQLNRLDAIQTRVLAVRQPTVLNSQRLDTAMAQSLAALRGYIILGSDPQRGRELQAQRRQAWQDIDQAVATLEGLSQTWTDPRNIDRLETIRRELAAFRVVQDEIEAIAQSVDNVPALRLLMEEAAPLTATILARVTAMIDEEATLDATADRKRLLGHLADVRGSLAMGTASIRAYLLTGDPAFRDDFVARWRVNEQAVQGVSVLASIMTPGQREAWSQLTEARAAFAPLPERLFEMRAADDWNRANHWLLSRAAPRAQAIAGLLREMGESQTELARLDGAELVAAKARVRQGLIGATVLAVLIGGAVAVLLSRRIASIIGAIVTRANAIAQGDLRAEPLAIRSRDELGDLTEAINQMSQSLRSVVSDVAGSAVEIAGAATQIAASSEEMASGMTEQSQQITQISSAVEEMSASVVEVARKSGEAAANATESGKVAEHGSAVVSQTVEDMNAINEAVTVTASGVEELGRRSEQIGQIIDVINDIADQTNLLALNAAIEAARAGDHGRGFAVVADEVRKLADRTTKATEEITGSIQAIQAETHASVTRMAAGTEQVSRGVERATQAGQSLRQIVDSARSVAGMIQSIAAAAEEQSAASEQISRNVETISAVTVQASKGASEAATAAAQLSNKAEHLQQLVRRFKLSA
jgi:methyl-accepting chemotaxis protein